LIIIKFNIAASTYLNEYSGSVLLDKNIEDELIDFKKNLV